MPLDRGVNVAGEVYPNVFASLCMAAKRACRHIDSRGAHAIHPTQTGLFHECKRLVDGSRGTFRASRPNGRQFRRRSCTHGQCHPRAGDGRGRAGEIRSSRHAHGHGGRCHRPVHAIPEIRSRRCGLARPRPLRALGRPRLDADLRAALSHRLSGDDHRRDQALPPTRLHHRRPSGIRPRARRRNHHRPARPGPGKCGRHGDRRAPHGGGVRRQDRRP